MYDQLEAQLHDLFWAAEGQNEELSLIENFLQQYPGTALELGCGSGRLLTPLLETGYLVEGLDNSEIMLQLCKERSQKYDPVLHRANIEDFRTGSIYGAITVPAFTLQLIKPEQISSVLNNIHQHLHPGGGLYFSIFIPWAEITGELEEDRWYLDQEAMTPDGHSARCYTRFQIRRISQALSRDHRYEIVAQDNELLEQSESSQILTWYWQREMALLLENAGFTIQQVIGDFDAELPCDDNCQILTVIASKNEEHAPQPE
jgi:SAM-dependent methyltransferase